MFCVCFFGLAGCCVKLGIACVVDFTHPQISFKIRWPEPQLFSYTESLPDFSDFVVNIFIFEGGTAQIR